MKNQTATRLHVNISDLGEWSVVAGAFYNETYLLSSNFLQISFNVYSALVTEKNHHFKKGTKLCSEGNFQLQDLDGSKLIVPKQDFKGNVHEKKSQSEIIGRAYYNATSGHVYETRTRRFALACPSETGYSLLKDVPITQVNPSERYKANKLIVYSKPCSSPRLYIFNFEFLVLNDIIKESTELKKSIQSQFNQLLDKSYASVKGVTFSKVTLDGTYRASTIAIAKCTQVKLDMRFIASSVDNPLEPLLSKGWPSFVANNPHLIIPKQNKRYTNDIPQL